MAGRIEWLRSGLWAVVAEIRREDVTFGAASIAYHASVSMLTILLLSTLSVSAVGSREFVDSVVVVAAIGGAVVSAAVLGATVAVP